MNSYQFPFYEEDLYETQTQHWINLFGQQSMGDIASRIQLILHINQQVFCEDAGYIEQILQLIKRGGITKSTNMLEFDTCPRVEFEDYLTDHMLRTNASIHHIIFQNKILGGDACNKQNQIILERGPHSSFHELMYKEDLYPHQQLSRFLKHEQSILEPGFLDEVKHIEQTFNKQFENNLFSIYKRDCLI